MALAVPLATTGDGGPGQRPVASPESPAFINPGANKDDWTCWNARNEKRMPFTMYGTFCLSTSTFSSVYDSKI